MPSACQAGYPADTIADLAPSNCTLTNLTGIFKILVNISANSFMLTLSLVIVMAYLRY